MSIHLPFLEGSTIIELGGGSNPIMKQITGLKSVNVDVRQVEGVDIVRNLEEDFSDIGQYDGLLAQYLLEHISWRKVKGFLENCYKVLKPGAYAVFIVPDTYAQMQKILQKKPEEITLDDSNFLFGGQDFSDNTHKWLISRPFLEKLLKEAGFTSVKFATHPDPDARDMVVKAYKGDISIQTGGVMLNLGSFTVTHAPPWINCDIRADIRQTIEDKDHLFEYSDVTKPLRWGDGEVDVITAYHLIEHLSREEGAFMLKECLRVLKPGGIIRLSTPDLDTFIKHVQIKDFKQTFSKEYEVEHSEDYTDAFFRLAFSGHKTIYNVNTLKRKLEDAGFTQVWIMEKGKSRSEDVERDAVELFADHSFFIEAEKPQFSGKVESVEKRESPMITTREQLQPYQRYLKGDLEEGEQ